MITLPTPTQHAGVEIGIERDKVVMKFAKPLDQFDLSSAHAMEVAVALMKHARRIGATTSIVWRVTSNDRP